MNAQAFAPITLYRPLQVFKTSFAPSKSIGTSFLPDHDFLVRIVTDYRSHQAMLRTEANDNYKNLENLLRGRHQLSDKTMSSLSVRLNVAPEELVTWVHGQEDGPLAPKLLELFALLETIPGAVSSQALATAVLCKCCGGNMLDDRNVFWESQPVSYDSPEYEFAERLLRATVGSVSIIKSIAGIIGETFSWDELCSLAHPAKYPTSHWFELVQTHYHVSSLAELSVKMQLMSASECRVPYERLKKWSSGQDLMPVAVAKALTKGTSEPNRLWIRFMLARTITFIIDFLCSAASTKPTRLEVQEIVYCRIRALVQNLCLASAENKKNARTNALDGGPVPQP